MKHNPKKHPHHRIHAAHQAHYNKLSPMERVGVWASDNLGTWQCLTLFTIIGAFCLWGAFTNNLFLTLVFGSISSYVIQLVSLSIIGIGQKVKEQRDAHVQAEMLKDLEEIKLLISGKLNPTQVIMNYETGADIILPNPIREKFDAGEVKSLADIT